MAIVKLAAPLAGLRGLFGGMVFSANGSGNYAKKWEYPKNRRTILQADKRAWFSTIRNHWQSLTSGQVAAWDALAASPPETDYNSLGDLIFLSGSAWHCRVNMRRLQAGDAIEDDCPPNASVAAPVSFGLEIYDFNDGASSDVFTYTSGDFTGIYASLFLAPTLSPVRTKQSNGYRSIWCGTVDTLTSTEINAELAAAFGWLSEGMQVFGELRRQSLTGIRSAAKLAVTTVQPVA